MLAVEEEVIFGLKIPGCLEGLDVLDTTYP